MNGMAQSGYEDMSDSRSHVHIMLLLHVIEHALILPLVDCLRGGR